MTDNEIIIKALMSQADNMLSAVVDEKRKTHFVTNEDVANFINRQNEEIDILIRKKNDLQDEIAEKDAEIERLLPFGCQVEVSKKIELEIKSEAIKEFAERLKNKSEDCTGRGKPYVTFEDIDDLVKEMTERSSAEL